MMATSTSKPNQQQVEEAVTNLLEADEYNNHYRYFRASDVAEGDPGLSSAMVGTYLPEIEDDSPLENGVIVEVYTDRRCGASLWIARKEEP
jgi:hypothetical protein